MRDQGVGVQRGLIQMRCGLDSIELMNKFRFECSHRLRVVMALWDWHAVSSLFLLSDIDPGRGSRGLSVCCKHLSKAHTLPTSLQTAAETHDNVPHHRGAQRQGSRSASKRKIHNALDYDRCTATEYPSSGSGAVTHSLMKGAEHLSSAGEAQLIDTGGRAAGHSD